MLSVMSGLHGVFTRAITLNKAEKHSFSLEIKVLETPGFLHMRKFCSLNTQMFLNEKSLF